MFKFLTSGLWICLVTSASVYAASSWSAGHTSEEKGYMDGLDYQKTRLITVPMIADGEIKGYLVAQFVFTADARTLRELSVPPEVFVVDEAFRSIYADNDIDFQNLEKFDLAELTATITERVNLRLKADIVQETLVEQFDYFPGGVMGEPEPVVEVPEAPASDGH